MQKGTELVNSDVKDNVIDFKTAKTALITGGPTSDEDWLGNLELGSIFLCRIKSKAQQSMAYDLYFLQERKEGFANVIQKVPDGRQLDLWVKTLEFSRSFEYGATLSVIELTLAKSEDEQSGETDGTSDRAVHSGRLVDDGTAEAGPEPHTEKPQE